MGTRTQLARSLFSAVVGLGLLSLVFLGSPGCGCGDDDLLPPGDQGPERCCCTFEWRPPRGADGEDVVITVENEDVALDAEVTPALFLEVDFDVAQVFTVCVNEEHLLGDQLDLVFTDQATNEEYGRAALIYDVRCRPVIERLTKSMDLISTDCGGGTPEPCCCEFEWLPSWQDGDLIDVTITAENVSPGLNPVISPAVLTDVAEGVIELIDICVDADHPLAAQMDLVVRDDPGGFVVGIVQLVYDDPCTPHLLPISAAPTLDITSTECGGEPLFCCCDFEWLPGLNMSGDVLLSAINVSEGMTVQITPPTLTAVDPRVFENFTVCVNASHQLLESFDLVISSTAGPEFGRARITYRQNCTPDIADVPGTGFGSLALTSTDCGGDPLLCCCGIEWQSPTSPSFAQIDATLENVDASLEPASVTPIQVLDLPAGNSQVFTVCVNPAHDVSATLDVVLRGPTGLEIARLELEYTSVCLPQAEDSQGEGFWNVLCQEIPKPGR